ncbi:MAG: DegT/DnrJ/EryC1/StrS family aminotransferase [Terriglobia bacterium]
MLIKMVDLNRQYQTLKSEIDAAIQSVLNSTEFILGSPVKEFEFDLASYLHVQHVIGCGSGTDALQIALMALGIGPGDEVMTPSFSFAATVETILLLGARPVYVDIDSRTFNLDVAQVESSLTPRTKALVPVHLFGQPVEMDPILAIAEAHGIAVIEDAAQAIGASYKGRPAGTMGRLGCFSFFPSKNLGAYGDGGAIVTNDDHLAERCRMISVHGSKKRYQHEILGINSRLDTLQAAILRVKLRHLESWTKRRIQIAETYHLAWQGLDLVTPLRLPHVRHVFNQYSLRTLRRDSLASFLKARDISSAIHYPKPLPLQPAFRQWPALPQSYAVSEAVSQEILSLPIFPEMEDAEVEAVISAVREFFR